jgi:hypothetical protein
MYGNHFYNETTRRYVAVFGTMFNDIVISRKTGSTTVQQMKVPINYAPMQKILARLDQDLQLNAPAITLPRMSFEMTGMTYSPDRKLTSVTKLVKASGADGSMTSMFAPAPYDIEFQLNIMTKYNEDGTKIIEQILPYFKPDCTVSVKLIDELGTYFDIPIVLNSVSQEDTYEGDFESRRALIWTLNFTMKGYFFGPVSSKKQITFVDSDIYPTTTVQSGADRNQAGSQITVAPGLKIDDSSSENPGVVLQAVGFPPAFTTRLTEGQKYQIYSLDRHMNYPLYAVDEKFGVEDPPTPTSVNSALNMYLGTTGIRYKVGDIITIPTDADANSRFDDIYKPLIAILVENGLRVSNIVTGQIADDTARDAFTQSIGIDDDWKAMVVVTDGDGDNAATSGVAKEHEE